MGARQLQCPLCCTETFACPQSLKYHLLSIIDNILCPECGARFQTILELAEHLDSECGKGAETAPLSKHEHFVNIKQEEHEPSDDINNSILAKALLTPQKLSDNAVYLPNHADEPDAFEVGEQAEAADADMEADVDADADANAKAPEHDDQEVDSAQDGETYSCLSCGTTFTSIVDHIQQFHDGEEVVVEMSEQGEKGAQEAPAALAEEGALISAGYDDEDELASTESQEELEVGGRARMPQILNTIKQEECVDKDGRLYTRKVVQIEKFWDDAAVKSRVPIVVKYALDAGGGLTKLEGGAAAGADAHTMEIYQCSSCGVQFWRRSQYDVHVCDPEVASEYKCSECALCFTNAQALCAHIKQHRGVKRGGAEAPPTGPFICAICDTEFPSNKSLRLHRRMHDPVKTKEVEAPVEYGVSGDAGGGEPGSSRPREMFQCKVCGKSYDKSYEEVHMAYHSGVNHYDCYICNRKFYTHSNLEMHMRVHGSEKGHLCPHCKKGFLTENSLKQHLKQHCSSRAYQCSYCSRRFARPHEKVKHERIHTGEKPHECEICGKTFRVSYCLTLHMRTHSGYRPYVCQHCGKRFKAHSVYNHHLLTHSDVRRYKCPYCPKAFKTGVQLAGHKNSHTKPFSCTHCNRPFASLYAVRAHMDTHKRENNLKYNCYLCGASYARVFALRDHIKAVHVDAPQNGSIALDIIEEGMEASTSILPDAEADADADADDISIVTLEMPFREEEAAVQ